MNLRKSILVVLLATAMLSYAQGHLKFKGVEINGNLKTFVANLEKKGCESGENILGVFMIKADFAGAEMFVFPQVTSQSQTVYAVVAGTSMYKEKVSMLAQYNELKDLLTSKYGEGKETTIADGYYKNEINRLERGNARNTILFETVNGKIYLYIHESAYQSLEAGSVNIQYIDSANEQLRLQEASNDI